MINVLLIANHSAGDLAALDRGLTTASLPVAGRTVLERSLEAIAALEPHKVTVAVSEDLHGARRLVAGGERWGVAASVVPIPFYGSVKLLLARHRWLQRQALLVVNADRLLDFALSEALAAFRDLAGDSSRGLRCRTSGLLWMPDPRNEEAPREVVAARGAVLTLGTPAEYHRAVFAISRGDHSHLSLRGRQQAVGLRHGYMTRISLKSLRSGHSFLGNHCDVHPTALLGETVVLEHGVSIGRMTQVTNSVVLADTVVGEHLLLRNAIVAGNTLIRVDTGVVLRLSDRWLLFERGAGLFSEYFSAPSHRVAGSLLLIFASLLMVPAVLRALSLGERPFETTRMLGNRGAGPNDAAAAFDAYTLKMGFPMLRRLPMLLAVAKGDLRLVGVSPLRLSEERDSRIGRTSERRARRAGLLGPTQLYLGLDAPLEERLASDEQVGSRGIRLVDVLGLTIDCLRRMIYRDAGLERGRWAGG